MKNLEIAFWMILGAKLGSEMNDLFLSADGEFYYFVAALMFVLLFGMLCLLDLVLKGVKCLYVVARYYWLKRKSQNSDGE